MAIYCFDLDDTICIPRNGAKNSQEKYGKADPVSEVISKLNSIYDAGHEVIIFIARRMLTHKGNLERIEIKVGDITRNWLSDHDVRYNKLIFRKPYANFYVDDKAVNLDTFIRMPE